ncbi:DUF5752 family protein [Desulfobulbus elongatus]|uniref:DUF5752 family protein n=1 Tax=Desulfobulbus elongatus TaxID=53332 RepID=UPI000481319E|nr:DUF5752 family protein [Desulfobulbus elongatus]
MELPFLIKDCTLIAIATGEEAHNLREFSDRLKTIHPGCIYYHFWGGMLRPSFDEPEYPNDFAAWAWRGLRDKRLAERLAIIDPSHYRVIEDLRQELIEVIEERLAESEWVPWARSGQRFKFIRSQIVVLDTGKRVSQPQEMAAQIAGLSSGSVFYHFIDARRRTESGRSDFAEWLQAEEAEEYSELVRQLNAIDPYFTTLSELRRELALVFQPYLVEGETS